jgi:hypothetical protein
MAQPSCSRSLQTRRVTAFASQASALIEERVQLLLHASPNHSVDVTLFLIRSSSVMTLPNRLGVLRHGGSFSLTWLRLATSSSARIGGC